MIGLKLPKKHMMNPNPDMFSENNLNLEIKVLYNWFGAPFYVKLKCFSYI